RSLTQVRLETPAPNLKSEPGGSSPNYSPSWRSWPMILPREAEAIQRIVAESFGDPVGVCDPDALERALSRPFAEKNGIPTYPTYFNKVSALFQSLLEHRPFAGANRRTALVITALLLEEKGYRLRAAADGLKPLL